MQSSSCLWLTPTARIQNININNNKSKVNVFCCASPGYVNFYPQHHHFPNHPKYILVQCSSFDSHKQFSIRTEAVCISFVWLWDTFFIFTKPNEKNRLLQLFYAVEFLYRKKSNKKSEFPFHFTSKRLKKFSLTIFSMILDERKWGFCRTYPWNYLLCWCLGPCLSPVKTKIRKNYGTLNHKFLLFFFKIMQKQELVLLNRPRQIRMQSVYTMIYWAITIDWFGQLSTTRKRWPSILDWNCHNWSKWI